MKSKEIYALALRIIGTLAVAYEVRLFGHYPSWPALFIIVRAIYLLIALYFIRGAPLLVKWAYPKPEE